MQIECDNIRGSAETGFALFHQFICTLIRVVIELYIVRALHEFSQKSNISLILALLKSLQNTNNASNLNKASGSFECKLVEVV